MESTRGSSGVGFVVLVAIIGILALMILGQGQQVRLGTHSVVRHGADAAEVQESIAAGNPKFYCCGANCTKAYAVAPGKYGKLAVMVMAWNSTQGAYVEVTSYYGTLNNVTNSLSRDGCYERIQ